MHDLPERNPRLSSVSIHAPRCRGAMRVHRDWPRLMRRSFNPRPPLPGSDAVFGLDFAAGKVVSIHAPRCRGAMRGPG